MDLLELTGQESGIIIYDNTVIVINWASYDTRLPVISPLGSVDEHYVNDIREALPGKVIISDDQEEGRVIIVGMEILADLHGDIPALWGYDIDTGAVLGATIMRDEDGRLKPTPGMVYHVNDATVIAPEGWV